MMVLSHMTETLFMRYAVSSEQIRFFHQNGFLELEDVLTLHDAHSLLSSIKLILKKSPGYSQENLYRSIPLVLALAKKRGWGEIVAELIKKKPLRIFADRYFAPDTELRVQITLDEESCGILLNLSKGTGLFFKEKFPEIALYNTPASCYFLVILTAKRLSNHLNPTVLK